MVSRKQWPTSSVAGYLMSPAPARTSLPSRNGQRRVPGSGNTLCEGHERRRKQCSRRAGFAFHRSNALRFIRSWTSRGSTFNRCVPADTVFYQVFGLPTGAVPSTTNLTVHSRANTGVVNFRVTDSTTGYTFTPCVGYVTSPGIDTKQKGSAAFSVSSTSVSIAVLYVACTLEARFRDWPY